MRLLKFHLIAVLGSAALVGCNSRDSNTNTNLVQTQTPSATRNPATGASTHDHAAETAVPRISVQEAQAAAAKGEAVFVDVRPVAAYNTGHIAGAISLPESEIDNRLATLPKQKKLITYCA